MFGPKSSLELTNRFERLFQVQHWVAARDTGAGSVHGSPLLDDLVPAGAATFVGEHVGRLAPVFRERAVIAAPVTLPGDEQDEFAALLALNTAFGLTRLSRKDFGGHR